jgi:hypothetical protein
MISCKFIDVFERHLEGIFKVQFTLNMEANDSSELLTNFHHNILRHRPREFFFSPNVTLKCAMKKIENGRKKRQE